MSESSVGQPEGSEFEFYLGSHSLFTTKLSTFWLTERRRVFGGNGQYWGNSALSKRMAWAAERAEWAPAAPSSGPVSHSLRVRSVFSKLADRGTRWHPTADRPGVSSGGHPGA